MKGYFNLLQVRLKLVPSNTFLAEQGKKSLKPLGLHVHVHVHVQQDEA